MEFKDQEVSVHNESAKRNVPDGADKDRKSAKKRRSSLATTRRSITGNVISYDIGINSSSSGNSQVADVLGANGTAVSQPAKGLNPNPANVRMDEIIRKFNTKIKVIGEEYAQWKQELRDWDDRESNVKLLSESVTPILAQDLPDEMKALSDREFITCEMVDFAGMEKRVDRQLLQFHISMNSCMKDLHLFRETVQGIQCANQLMKTDLSSSSSLTDFGEGEFRDGCLGRENSGLQDVKCHIENLINTNSA